MKASVSDVLLPKHRRALSFLPGNEHLPFLAQRGYRWHSSLDGYDIFFKDNNHTWVIVSKEGGPSKTIWESQDYPNQNDMSSWKKIHSH